MATLHDTALGTNDTSGTSLATADALTVTAGDCIFVVCKWEGASGSTASISDGSNSYTSVNAQVNHANGDLNGQTFVATAGSTTTLTITLSLTSARPYRMIRAYSFTPAGGQTLTQDAVNAGSAAGGSSGAFSYGTASATGAGFSVMARQSYGGEVLTAGSGWSIAAEFTASSALPTQYQLQSGAGTITADGSISTGFDYIWQLAVFKEVAGGGSSVKRAMLMGIG